MTLTEKDIDEIKQIVDEKLDEKIKILPTKDEFFSKMDEVVGELKTIREEQTILTHKTSGHEDRIVSLEKIHPNGKHATV